MNNSVNWFEIPVENFDRANKFYSSILDAELHVQEMMNIKMGFLPCDQGAVGGSICQGEGYVPSDKGTVVYLNGGDDLNKVLNRVESAGGKVLMPKTQINEEIGYMAFFGDSEGNKVALHSYK